MKFTVPENLQYFLSKNSRKIQRSIKIIQAAEKFQFLSSSVELSRAFKNGVYEVSGICSSKHIVQTLFHAESLNVK